MTPAMNTAIPPSGTPRQSLLSRQAAWRAAPLLALSLAIAPMPALSGPGHDAPVAASASAAAPSFEAHSDLFEIVGRLQPAPDGHGAPQLTLWLDRWASGEPVANARIEIEASGEGTAPLKAQTEARPDGSYTLPAAFAQSLAVPGSRALTLTVSAGDEADLLAADFTVATGALPGAAPASWPARLGSGIAIAAAIAAAVAALILAVRRLRRRPAASGRSS